MAVREVSEDEATATPVRLATRPGGGRAGRVASPQGDVAGLGPETVRARSRLRVALVSMPFVTHTRPSIQLGLLGPIAESHGFPVTTFHLYLDFAHRIGTGPYETICRYGRHVHAGEWLFSVEAFGDGAPDRASRLLRDRPADADRLLANLERPAEWLLSVRKSEVPAYLDQLMDEIDWGRFAVVGFTSTFEQNTPSFALAARIKRRFPAVTTLFGGANFEGEMGIELVRSVPAVDYAVSGEGDTALPEFLIALQEGRDPAALAGVVARRHGTVHPPPERPLLDRLDDLPDPNYDEYFERAERLGLFPGGGSGSVRIPFESARGCWWGQRRQCTFCGLNGGAMRFRSKSPERVREELGQVARRHGTFRFAAVDNILDSAYLRTLLPALVEDGQDYDLFYEVKANLSRDQIRLLRDAGVRNMQPGVESLSTHVLSLMRKGISGIRNVNTLRWARHYRVNLVWSILFGFPGETAADYRMQERLVPLIAHLQPPLAAVRIDMDRFSPIFDDRRSFPVRSMQPGPSYGYIYPDGVDLSRVAYTFEYEFAEGLPNEEFAGIRRLVGRWNEAWQDRTLPSLTYERDGRALLVEDRRDPAAPAAFTLTDPLATAYVACSDRPATAARVVEAHKLAVPPAVLDGALDEMCDLGLMMREGSHVLSLALPTTEAG